MFDPFAQTLFENLPDFQDLTAEVARRMLSRAYLSVIKLKTGDIGPDTSTQEIIQYLRRLADTIEFYTVLDDSVEISHRRAGAFVVAESLALLAELHEQNQPDLQAWQIQRHWTYTRIEAGILYLIAGYDACATGVVSEIVFEKKQRDAAAEQGSNWCLEVLLSLCKFHLNPLPAFICPVDFVKENNLDLGSLEEDTIGRLYALLGEAVASFLRWLSGHYSEGFNLSVEKLERLIDNLTSQKNTGFEAGIGGAYSRVRHLATLLYNCFHELKNRALVYVVPLGKGFTPARYNDYLKMRACGSETGDVGRPVLWPSAKEYVLSCLSGDAKHAVVSMPTGSGKSFVAELAISQSVGMGWCLYLAPTNALTEQIRSDLRKVLRPLGTEVLAFVGDQEYSILKTNIVTEMPPNSVAVMTPEKAFLALRLYPDVFTTCQLVVFDECHLLGETDSGRGVIAELVLCQLMLRSPVIRILLMSAMVQNPDDLARWLETATGSQSEIIRIPWRPTRTLRSALGVDRNSGVENYKVARDKLEKLSERRKNEKFRALYSLACGLQGAWQSTDQADYGIVPIACETELRASRKKNELGEWNYFPDADKWVNGSAIRIASFLAEHSIQTLVFTPASKHYPFSNASNIVLSTDYITSLEKQPHIVQICRLLAEYEFGLPSDVFKLLKQGVSVHTAHMLETEKIASETAFRARATRIMFATGTLAQGLNLPATAVVIAGTRIGDPRGEDAEVIERRKLSQLLNAAGRAGRAGFANQGLVIAVPDTLLFLDSYEDIEKLRKKLGYLQQPDNAVKISSGLESFLDQVAEGVLDTATASVVELQTIAVLSGGDQDQFPPEKILQKSFAAYQRKKKQKLDVSELAAKHLIAIRDTFTKKEHVPLWVPLAAQRSGLDFFLTVAIVNSWARIRPKISEEILRWTVFEWIEELLRIISYIPPKTLLRHFPMVTIGKGSKKLRSFKKDYRFQSIDRRDWIVDAEWIDGWSEVIKILKPWMEGVPLIELATLITGIVPEEISPSRTTGKHPIPKTIALVNGLFSSLAILSGGLVAVVEQLFQEFIDQGNVAFEQGVPLPLNCLPMCVKYGCDSPGSLAWYRFGIRLRRPSRLLHEAFPVPDINTDEALREWVRKTRRDWLNGYIDIPEELYQKNLEVFSAIDSFIKGVD